MVLQKFLSVFIPKLCFPLNKATDAPLDLAFSRVLPPSLRGPWELIFDTPKIRCKFLLGGNDLIDIIQLVHAWFYESFQRIEISLVIFIHFLKYYF